MGATAGATSESTVERLGGRAAGWASCRSDSVRHGAIERTRTGAGDAGRRATPPPPRAPSLGRCRVRPNPASPGRACRPFSRASGSGRFAKRCGAALPARAVQRRACCSLEGRSCARVERIEAAAGGRRAVGTRRPSGLPGTRQPRVRRPRVAGARTREPRTQATRRGRRPDIAPPLAGSFNPLGGRERTPFPAIVDDKFWPVRAFVAAIPYSSILTKQLHSMERGCLMTSV